MQNRTRVTLKAADNYELAAYFLEHEQPIASVMIGCATAVHQKFYFPFAAWLNGQGFNVLTFDYRGIGESFRESSMKHSKAKKQDWGELDMPAALDWLHERRPDLPVHLVGHSAGGVLIGLLPNYRKLRSIVCVGCSTGYANAIAMPERLAVFALLRVYFPLTTKIFGYLPAKKLGWGEDLPIGVARQWAEWCLSPGYIANAFGKDIDRHYYDELDCPILFLNMSDDPITTAANIASFLELLPRARTEARILRPSDYNLAKVGHMGFFRSKNCILWSAAGDWLKAHS